MSKQNKNNHSRYSLNAILLMAKLIKSARKQKQMTASELAERAGISRGLLQRIEKGDTKCSIGAVFEVATIVGIKLFESEDMSLQHQIHQANEKLALLPKSIRKKTKDLNDDF